MVGECQNFKAFANVCFFNFISSECSLREKEGSVRGMSRTELFHDAGDQISFRQAAEPVTAQVKREIRQR